MELFAHINRTVSIVEISDEFDVVERNWIFCHPFNFKSKELIRGDFCRQMMHCQFRELLNGFYFRVQFSVAQKQLRLYTHENQVHIITCLVKKLRRCFANSRCSFHRLIVNSHHVNRSPKILDFE